MPLPSADKLQGYIETARRQQRQRQESLCLRRQQGVAIAKEAADVLRTFGASRVVLFGFLVARLQNELVQLDRVVEAANTQADKAKRTGDSDFFQAAALSLQNYYRGAERIFEAVAKGVDQSLPSGASSHQAL